MSTLPGLGGALCWNTGRISPMGTARNGSKDKAYLGNGDQIVFAMNDVAMAPAMPAMGAGPAQAAPAPAGGGTKY